jgi:3-phenylpropionate/trans-cinnamate dioxygenase ferredoxin reductase subunit
MRRTCNLTINGRTIKANIGETLVDAALGGWVVIPHDCCSGQCETCRVAVVSGAIDDQQTSDGRGVLACQATIEGDAEVEFDDVPVIARRTGVLSEVNLLGPDVLEVVVELRSPLEYRPGQYVAVKFSGFPWRDLSPTLRLDGTSSRYELVFQLRRYPGGLVSTQIGSTITRGHRVQVRGPYGQGFLRDAPGPLVLIGGGTGWAPIWSLARAARRSQRYRDVVVIAGVRRADELYMRPSLEWLVDDGVREVIATAETGAIYPVLSGRPTHYLPSLGPEDTVYVAGPSGLVSAVKGKAREAAARCYADPFLPSARRLSLIDRVRQLLRDGTRPAATGISNPAAHGAANRLIVNPRPGSGPIPAVTQSASSNNPPMRQRSPERN